MATYETGDLALYDRRWAGVIICKKTGDVVVDCHNSATTGQIDSAKQLAVLHRSTATNFLKTVLNIKRRTFHETSPSAHEKKVVEHVVGSMLKNLRCEPTSSDLVATIFKEAAAMQRLNRDQFAIMHYFLFARLP